MKLSIKYKCNSTIGYKTTHALETIHLFTFNYLF